MEHISAPRNPASFMERSSAFNSSAVACAPGIHQRILGRALSSISRNRRNISLHACMIILPLDFHKFSQNKHCQPFTAPPLIPSTIWEENRKYSTMMGISVIITAAMDSPICLVNCPMYW